jgi:hypothetical protein
MLEEWVLNLFWAVKTVDLLWFLIKLSCTKQLFQDNNLHRTVLNEFSYKVGRHNINNTKFHFVFLRHPFERLISGNYKIFVEKHLQCFSMCFNERQCVQNFISKMVKDSKILIPKIELKSYFNYIWPILVHYVKLNS